ncbi:CMGC/DYRK/YAK protein kinase Ppk15 [Schizosaccharomyces octosporus yFS286]|uniref:CMGC/DYRK/YAK protein kinase Ppk15 n=1 Tax=Schizosaccharomyces octosporus (strain yFS286) TaxID=483514 RepID=S9R3Q6_SCHOY|nr:CMGC/DYRK/YAK protein kinase Ppk15 [Schizosaccharomyces octosporus yFS286]EPX73005.1 CMGC/DYRK/YAK protein kinase Ppk15 [Schizosaccharomyces octosporus yFS286]
MDSNSPILPLSNNNSGNRTYSRPPQTSHARHVSSSGANTAFTTPKPPMSKNYSYRRASPNGSFISPLEAVSVKLANTYAICNPKFQFSSEQNPRRPLTKPSEGLHNHGYDNANHDYVLYVNDLLGTDEGRKYLILDTLGHGTFGQVAKCQDLKTQRIVAIKVIKNKPAFYNQCVMEVSILEFLNNRYDPDDKRHLIRLYDQFMHKNHLCLVFELLSINLYELIKQNQFRGLHLSLVRSFAIQLLSCASLLKQARIIHCDMKPENILLQDLSSPNVKVIDFGSACHERQTVYTYIQSRFYRSPEVVLGLHYNCGIDMWSIGCILAELFLGLPLFPGNSEYNQICRIVDMLGNPPAWMIEMGKNAKKYFNISIVNGRKIYELKSIEQFSIENNKVEQPGKQYFGEKALDAIIMNYPRRKTTPKHTPEEHEERLCFIDFVKQFLELNPLKRWSPDQAKLHPFITGASFSQYYMNKQKPPFVTPRTRNRSHTIGNQAMVPPSLQRASTYVTNEPEEFVQTRPLPQYYPPAEAYTSNDNDETDEFF